MPVIRKVQSKLNLSAASTAVAVEPEKTSPEKEDRSKKAGSRTKSPLGSEESPLVGVRKKKVCNFCTGKQEPKYWDVATLKRYMNDRGRIVSRGRSGACAKHQRRVGQEIKRARHLALLPYSNRL